MHLTSSANDSPRRPLSRDLARTALAFLVLGSTTCMVATAVGVNLTDPPLSFVRALVALALDEALTAALPDDLVAEPQPPIRVKGKEVPVTPSLVRRREPVAGTSSL